MIERRELTIALKKKNIKQKQIASILGVTESAVSQYMKNKRVLVTGADGFIGSHLTEMLVKNGAKVKALSQLFLTLTPFRLTPFRRATLTLTRLLVHRSKNWLSLKPNPV